MCPAKHGSDFRFSRKPVLGRIAADKAALLGTIICRFRDQAVMRFRGNGGATAARHGLLSSSVHLFFCSGSGFSFRYDMFSNCNDCGIEILQTFLL